MVVGMLTEAIDKLAALDPHDLATCEDIEALYQLRDRFDAVLANATAAFEAGGEWRGPGARGAASWISILCGQPFVEAKTMVGLGRAVRDMDRVAEAWSAGEITRHHVSLLARARTPVTAAAFDRDEKLLVDDAIHMRYSRFKNTLAYWMIHADPDGTETSGKDKEDSRRFHLSQSYQDMWLGDFALDPIGGTIVYNDLKAIEDELFTADWAEARERVGDGATVADLRRTASQRLADALVEMATRSMAMPTGARRPEPLFSVFVGYETMAGPICELANGTVVAPGRLVPWLDRAWIKRVVFESPSRVIDVGEERRLFAGATRRAIEVRDRECYHPFCELPAELCEADHIEPWSEGGPTVEANGRLACGFHNRLRNERDTDEPKPDAPAP